MPRDGGEHMSWNIHGTFMESGRYMYWNQTVNRTHLAIILKQLKGLSFCLFLCRFFLLLDVFFKALYFRSICFVPSSSSPPLPTTYVDLSILLPRALFLFLFLFSISPFDFLGGGI